MIEISADDAWQNVYQNNRQAHWKTVVARMNSACVLADFARRREIHATDNIFCIGSCFAKNIEKQLIAAGLPVLSHPDFAPADGGLFSALPNIFNVWSLYNEILWGIGESATGPETCMYTDAEGNVYDATSTVDRFRRPHADLLAQRAGVTANVRRLKDCRILVLTLGLAEVWYDQESGYYLNSTLPKSLMDAYPKRFVLRVLDYPALTQGLEAVHNLLQTYGKAELEIFISISPVPLSATFTSEDVLVANNYSKSAQLAAVLDFSRRHNNVTYVPSFESVMYSTRRFAWEMDGRHVTDAMVRQITRRFLMTHELKVKPGELDSDIVKSDWPVLPPQLSVLDHLPRFQAAKAGDEDFPAGFPRVTASSVMEEQYSASYMMSPAKGCWHAQRPPQYPEGLIFEFDAPLTVHAIFLRAQDDLPERAPYSFELLFLKDEEWHSALRVSDIAWGLEGMWKMWRLPHAVCSATFLLRFNAGPPDLLTLRSVYLSPKPLES